MLWDIKALQPCRSLQRTRCYIACGTWACVHLAQLWQCGILAACSGPFVQSTGVTSSCEETSSLCLGKKRKMEQEKIGRGVCFVCESGKRYFCVFVRLCAPVCIFSAHNWVLSLCNNAQECSGLPPNIKASGNGLADMSGGNTAGMNHYSLASLTNATANLL